MKKDHTETTELCIALIKAHYDPGELTALAEKLDTGTMRDVRDWIDKQNPRPVVMLKILNQIDALSRGHGHDPDFIRRRVVAECRNAVAFQAKADEWERDNGGPGAYAKAANLKISEALQMAGRKD